MGKGEGEKKQGGSGSEEETPTKKEIKRFYRIGTPGKKWDEEERQEWKAQTKIQRSYQDEVLKKIEDLKQSFNDGRFVVEQYGSLSHNPERYPLFAVTVQALSTNDNNVAGNLLVTGGVHGYETSGVQGALLFLQTKALEYASKGFNIVVAPCVSPWAYENIQRWQADLLDPNRSFKLGSQTEESKQLMDFLSKKQKELLNSKSWTCHLDLHETTDTDATEFMPAKHAEAGLEYDDETIPDGFYLVGDSENSQLDFQKAVIESVRKVTHIAPPDSNGNIIDFPMSSEGVIVVPATQLGLCCSVTDATYKTTTEVYPDSPKKVTSDDCNNAQVAAVTGALDYILSTSS